MSKDGFRIQADGDVANDIVPEMTFVQYVVSEIFAFSEWASGRQKDTHQLHL